MSDLYYANLIGKKNYEIDKRNAKFRLQDFLDFLCNAKENSERKEYSIHWKILSETKLEEMIRSRKINQMRKREQFNDYEEIEFEKLLERNNKLQEQIQIQVQKEINDLLESNKTWVQVKEKKRTEQGYRLIQQFLKSPYIFEQKNLNIDGKIIVLDKDFEFNAILLERAPKSKKIYTKYYDVPLNRQIDAVHQLKLKPQKMHWPLLKLVMNKYYVDWPDVKLEQLDDWFYLTEDDREGIEEQRKFVN
ncbi:MAG: hypothetical protein ACOC44_20680, partial [Promethearchaeia archaeon]